MKYRVGLCLLAALSLPLIFQSTPTEILKLKIFDSLVPTPPESGHFATLNITEEDIANEGGYPLSRQRLAEIHLEILEQGAIGVGWALAFPQEDRFQGDFEFASALALSPSVLSMFENPNGKFPKTTGTVILGDDIGGILIEGVIENYPMLSANASQGIASARVEVDGLVRRMPLLYRTPDGWTPAFATQILKSLTGADTYVIKTNENGIQEVRVRGLNAVKTDSFGRKWVSWIVPRETTLSEMDVEGRFVIVGVTAKGVMPQVAVPNRKLLEPHKIQGALAESILIENSPYIPDYALAVEVFTLIASVIAIWLLINGLGVTWGISLALVVFASTGVSGAFLIRSGLLIDVSWTLISQFITASIAFYLNFREQYRLRQQIKKQFEHYLDPRQVKRLQANPELLKLGGEKREATFLFTDVRGFTSLSEALPPEDVVYIMNRALTAQADAVMEYEGTVDKYIGDAMMAIFNAPFDQEDHETRAVQCAWRITENMHELNKELSEKNLPLVAIGIGINTGDAVIGNMGSEKRFDYTAIGDAVNTAARLESATKEHGANLLVGEQTAKKCQGKLHYHKDIEVKGKKIGLKTYTWDLS